MRNSQIFRLKGRALQLTEWLCISPRHLVNAPSSRMLAGPGFRQQQNGHVALGKLADNGFDGPHACADAFDKSTVRRPRSVLASLTHNVRQLFPHSAGSFLGQICPQMFTCVGLLHDNCRNGSTRIQSPAWVLIPLLIQCFDLRFGSGAATSSRSSPLNRSGENGKSFSHMIRHCAVLESSNPRVP